jgi:hypothetical protein
MPPSKNAILAQEGLRIDLFRMHPHTDYESGLVDQFAKRLNPTKIASFKALGHYDIICFYPFITDDIFLFKGSIKGIRSFSNIDCICKADKDPSKIISELQKSKFVIIAIIAFDIIPLADNGGIINNITISLTKTYGGFHLNSPSWGEQILIIHGNSMNQLLTNYRSIMESLISESIDINSIVGINYDLINNMGELWDEEIPEFIKIEWHVELILPHSKDFSDKIRASYPAFISDDNICSISNSSKVIYDIKSNRWADVINSIRSIRRSYATEIVTTKLTILYKS